MWHGPDALQIAYVFDHIDFLPAGKGPVILIMGGVGMLFLSLFAAMVTRRATPRRDLAAAGGHASAPAPQAIRVDAPRTRSRRAKGGWIAAPGGTTGARVIHETVLQAATVPERGAWLPVLLDAAARADLGRPRVLTSGQGRHAILVTNCRSCTDPRRDASLGCDRERDVLERALRSVTPNGRVLEVSCKPKRPGACIFEILPGGGA